MMYDTFFNDVFDSLFDDTFSTSFGPTFKAPRIIKSMTDSNFPQSNVFVNKDTKECKITVCLPGISKDEVKLVGDDNVIALSINRKTKDISDWAELQNGFTIPTKAKVSWRVDPSKYDLDTLKVDFSNGLMTITIEPTEAPKSKKRFFFGNNEEAAIEEK